MATYTITLNERTSSGKALKNKGLVPVSHKNIINPAVGKEQTAKGGVLYGGNVQPLAISRLLVMSYLTGWAKEIVRPS